MTSLLVPILARSPEGEILHFSSAREAAKLTGHASSTVYKYIGRATPTKKGWEFCRASNPAPFTKENPTAKTIRGIPIEDDQGLLYPNMKTAALLLGVSAVTVTRRVQSGRYKERVGLKW